MSKTIVVASHGDDTPTHDALTLGVSLAQALDGRIILAGLWASPLGSSDGVYESSVRARIEDELASLKRKVPDEILTTSEISGATSVARGLHRVAVRRHADIAVVGPSGVGHAARGFRGNVALGAAHDAPCTVAVAPAGLDASGVDGADVVLAWDDSPEARVALETAVELARSTGGTLHVAFVLETPYRYAQRLIPHKEMMAWTKEVVGRGEEAVERAEALVAGRVPVTSEIREGLAAQELVLAAHGRAFLVAGSRGHGSLRRLVLGSTTAQVIEHATIPVLLVPRGDDGA